MTINREHLEPCPFCGAAAHATPEHRPTRMPEHVMCLGCGAELDGLGSIEQWNTRAQAQAAPQAEPVEVVAVVTTARKKGISEQRALWHGEDGADQWVAHMQGRGCETSKTLLMTVAQHNRIMASAPQHDAELVELLDQAYAYPLEHACATGSERARDLCERIDAKLAALSAKNEGGRA